jgi:hypothetical protein
MRAEGERPIADANRLSTGGRRFGRRAVFTSCAASTSIAQRWSVERSSKSKARTPDRSACASLSTLSELDDDVALPIVPWTSPLAKHYEWMSKGARREVNH